METPKPKRPVGRPPGTGKPIKPEGERLIKVTLRIRPDQRAKLEQLGGEQGASDWLRKQIDAS